MAKSGKMQQVVMRVLAVMLVASLALAIAVFALPQSALAGGGPGEDEERAEPNVICGCCTWGYYFCINEGPQELCYHT